MHRPKGSASSALCLLLFVVAASAALPSPAVYLPYTSGETWSMVQGPNGTTHQGTAYWGYDFWDGVEGSAIRAARGGRVVKADIGFANGRYENHGWGNCVLVDHGDGTRSRYAHLSRVDVHVGWDVATGRVLGGEGNTGWSSAVHLHFQQEDADSNMDGPTSLPTEFVEGNQAPWTSQNPGDGRDDANFKAAPGQTSSPDLRTDSISVRPGQVVDYTFYCFNRGETMWPAGGSYYLHHNGHQLGLGPALDYEQVDWTTTPGNAWTKHLILTIPNWPGQTKRLTGRMARKDGDNYTEFGEYIDVDIHIINDTLDQVGRGSINPDRFRDCFARNGGAGNVGSPQNDVHTWDTVPECQGFTGGAGLAGQIQWNKYTSQAYWLHGSHFRKYNRWLLGTALSDEWRVGDTFFRTRGVRQDFQWGSMYCADGAEARLVYGDDHWVKFKNFGGIYSLLGWPTTEPYDNPPDVWQAFEGGWVTRDAGIVFAADRFPVPVTDLDVITGIDGNNGWFRSPVRIHLQPNVPSVDRYWRYAGGDWLYNPPLRRKWDDLRGDTRLVDHAGVPIDISQDGRHTIEYYSTMTEGASIAGGGPRPTEAVQRWAVKIDSVPPTPNELSFAPATATPGAVVNITIHTTDATSGVVDGQIGINRATDGTDSGEWFYLPLNDFAGDKTLAWDTAGWPAGRHLIRAECVDQAGNWQRDPTFEYRLSNTPPTKPRILTITPSAPGPETLTAHAIGSTDVNGDSVTYQYQWSRKKADGTWEGFSYSGETLPASNVRIGETWGVRARAYDGTSYSAWNSACVTITSMAGVIPAPKTYGVPVTSAVFVAFRWPVRQPTVTSRVQLKLNTKVIPTVMTWVTAERKVKLRPRTALLPNTYYRINIDPGITCASGRVLGWSENYWFKTAPATTTAAVTVAAAPTSGGAELTVNLASAATVRTVIANIAGRAVAELPERDLPAGVSSLLWNGKSNAGCRVPPGMYLVRVEASGSDGAQATAMTPMQMR